MFMVRPVFTGLRVAGGALFFRKDCQLTPLTSCRLRGRAEAKTHLHVWPFGSIFSLFACAQTVHSICCSRMTGVTVHTDGWVATSGGCNYAQSS